ncbi:hypothetical protein DPMN_166853 [Dreissena polymorpha]|uniref:Uncharacterized protein n=1 Tax=Dreissena polymorpha TaxID=45954 RepID=A0A9D4IVU6_DREPO|nr:hypothetical protein DPMN_166853 [Dreissena polymorpha]
MDTVESVSCEELVLGVYGGDNENAPQVGSEPTNSRLLGGHLIHYTTAYMPEFFRSKAGHSIKNCRDI